MKPMKTALSLIFLCSMLTFISCDQEVNCTNEISTTDVNVVYSYNSYFDFFNAIESFDFVALAAQNILIDLGSNANYAVRYELNFPNGYVDALGNSITGKIFYSSKFVVENAPGNEIVFDFVGLNFNGIDVSGKKILNFESATAFDWCGNVTFSSAAQVTVFEGCLSKLMAAQNIMVSGTNTLVVDQVRYEMEITEPILMKENCNWFTSGKLAVKAEKTSILTFDQGCESIEMTLSNEAGCHSVQLIEHHDFW